MYGLDYEERKKKRVKVCEQKKGRKEEQLSVLFMSEKRKMRKEVSNDGPYQANMPSCKMCVCQSQEKRGVSNLSINKMSNQTLF